MKTIIYSLMFALTAVSAHASAVEEGYCYAKAEQFKAQLHSVVLLDVASDFEGGLNQGEETFVYSQDRYAVDNLEEVYTFTIPVGNDLDGVTNFKYTITIETWLSDDNTASICDVIGFRHEKTY